MANKVTWIDRLRIERVVWLLDQRLYDLPRASRIARRREVRENLLTAARDIGTRDALRRLGDGRQLAGEYLAAEFGEGPRHSWVAAAVFAGTAGLVLNWVLGEAALSFGAGITTAQPGATGTFTWSGIPYVQEAVTYTFVEGTGTWVGGAWTPTLWIIGAASTVLAGRLWRALPMWRRRSAPAVVG